MRYFFLMFLAFLALPANADWTHVVDNTIGGRSFIDVQTLKIKGNLRRVLELQSWREPHSDGSHSRVYLSFPRFFVCQRTWFMLPVFPDVAR